jgi:hypothetical protein
MLEHQGVVGIDRHQFLQLMQLLLLLLLAHLHLCHLFHLTPGLQLVVDLLLQFPLKRLKLERILDILRVNPEIILLQ